MEKSKLTLIEKDVLWNVDMNKKDMIIYIDIDINIYIYIYIYMHIQSMYNGRIVATYYSSVAEFHVTPQSSEGQMIRVVNSIPWV